MAKGFLIGAIWGGVLAVGGAAVLSVMHGPVANVDLPGRRTAPEPGSPVADAPAEGAAADRIVLEVAEGSARAAPADEGQAREGRSGAAPAGDASAEEAPETVELTLRAPQGDTRPEAAGARVTIESDSARPDDATEAEAEVVIDLRRAEAGAPGQGEEASASAAAPEAEVATPEPMPAPEAEAAPEPMPAREEAPSPEPEAPPMLAEGQPDAAAEPGEAPAGQPRPEAEPEALALAPAAGDSPAAPPRPEGRAPRAAAPQGIADPEPEAAQLSEGDPLADPAVGPAPEAPGGAGSDPAPAPEIAALSPVAPPAAGALPEAPDPEEAPEAAADPGAPPAQGGPEAPEVRARAEAEPEAPGAGGADAAAAEPERLNRRDGSLLASRAPAVRQNRLPRIGAEDPEDPQPAAKENPAPVEAETALGGPLTRYAVSVDLPQDVPRMAVVLIDDGSGPLGPQALESFPFPITFAIAPSHPDPGAAAAAYRALGFEVMVVGALPEGAQPTDVEVALGGALNAVPQAVAVLEDPSGSLQADRAVAAQVTEVLLASGHGLVTVPKGLNTAQKLATKAGVPAVSLFRDFDAEGQDAAVIRRIFDQAAFRARQEGGVVMVGRLRADTVSALVLWGLQDRGSSITLVPVSVVLREAVSEQ